MNSLPSNIKQKRQREEKTERSSLSKAEYFRSTSDSFLEKKARVAQELLQNRTHIVVRSINCKRDWSIRARMHELWDGGKEFLGTT